MSSGGLGQAGLADFGLGAPSTGMAYDASLTLNSTAVLLTLALLDASAQRLHSSVAAHQTTDTLDAAAAQTLASFPAATQTTLMDQVGDMALAGTAQHTGGGSLLALADQVISGTASVQLTNGMLLNPSMSANTTSTLANTNDLVLYGDASLGATPSHDTANVLDSVAATQVMTVVGYDGTAAFDANLQITVSQTAALQQATGVGVFTDLTLAQTSAYVVSVEQALAGLLDLGTNADVGDAGSAPVYNVNRTLTSLAGWLPSSQVDAVGQQAVSSTATLAPTNTLELVAVQTVAAVSSLTAADVNTMSAILAFGQTATLVLTTNSSSVAAMVITQTGGFLSVNTLTAVATLELQQATSLSASNNIEMLCGIPLATTGGYIASGQSDAAAVQSIASAASLLATNTIAASMTCAFGQQAQLDLTRAIDAVATLTCATTPAFSVGVLRECFGQMQHTASASLASVGSAEWFMDVPAFHQTAAYATGNQLTLFQEQSVASVAALLFLPQLDKNLWPPSIITAEDFGSFTIALLISPSSIVSEEAFGQFTNIPDVMSSAWVRGYGQTSIGSTPSAGVTFGHAQLSSPNPIRVIVVDPTIYGRGQLLWCGPDVARGTGQLLCTFEVEHLPDACPPALSTFRWLQRLLIGDLELHVLSADGLPCSPVWVRYAIYQVTESGALVLLGQPDRSPEQQAVGHYYCTGTAGEFGQPGEFLIRWQWQRFWDEAPSTFDQYFIVEDAVLHGPPDATCRSTKTGWL